MSPELQPLSLVQLTISCKEIINASTGRQWNLDLHMHTIIGTWSDDFYVLLNHSNHPAELSYHPRLALNNDYEPPIQFWLIESFLEFSRYRIQRSN